ncbi:unnamed protein product [Rotaria socialis]|uniref:Uncharacterized protein n=1 Tax=Rotaria socialis TaxID=392032 RepID=A0A820X7B4_9BILA|nr:unnamed protein product [Rotaria socialis]
MAYKLDIVHKKYYYNKRIELISVSLVETDRRASYDYDRGTAWKAEGGDWSSTYRMAAYFQTIQTRKIYEDLNKSSQEKLVRQLAAEWHTYVDYYTMKLKLALHANRVIYDLSKSGIVGSGHCGGSIDLS